MDKREAKALLAAQLAQYRSRSYTDLQRLLTTRDTPNARGESGIVYQLVFDAFWDDKRRGHLRVMGSIDDGGIRAFFPLCDSFIMAPDGTFIGEDDDAP